MKKNIALVGFMATGKTTVGKALAEYLGLDFIDLDEMIANKHGKSIQQIFADHGEEYFREQETLAIEEVCNESSKVIATGGGAVLRQENITCLLARAHVVCLTASPKVVFERTQEDCSRPLLEGKDRLERITSLMMAREGYYAQAEHVVNTDEWDLRAIVANIGTFLENNGWAVNK